VEESSGTPTPDSPSMSCIQGQSRTAAACVGRGRGCWWGLITLGRIIRESRICDSKSDSSGLDTHWLRIGTCSVCLNYKISLFRVVFWDRLPCKMIVDRRFRGAYCLHHHPDDGRNTHLWNVGLFLRDYTVQHPRRLSIFSRRNGQGYGSTFLCFVVYLATLFQWLRLYNAEWRSDM